jgi:hypothetical protein
LARTAAAACTVSLESQPVNNGSAPAIAASIASYQRPETVTHWGFPNQ